MKSVVTSYLLLICLMSGIFLFTSCYEPENNALEEREFNLTNDVTITLVWIPSGSFDMGSPDNEQDRQGDEDPVHRVTFATGFWLGKYEVTQVQWEAVMGDNPSYYDGANRPVERVSWTDIQSFESALGNVLRLPSESEWEYACRAGTQTRFYWGDDPNYTEIDNYAVYGGNDNGGTEEVGTKHPNSWGLYDMSGNVNEWCEDWIGAYPFGSVTDPRGPSSGSFRVWRGGDYYYNAQYCRSASRGFVGPSSRGSNLGFRLVRDAASENCR